MITRVTWARRGAALLESGRLRGPFAALGARTWTSLARVARPVALPPHARVVGVGGARLGGSGKTPLVLALARRLAHSGVSVAVQHPGYRGALGQARRVLGTSRARDVGDEAVWLARALEADGVPVFAGPDRELGLGLAARHAEVVLADGLLQASPVRLAASLLVIHDDELEVGACPPLGDLRTAPTQLRALADAVVVTGRPPRAREFGARSQLGDAIGTGQSRRTIRSLLHEPVGVLLGIAHPERVLAQLAAAGLRPAEIRLAGDHEAPSAVPTRVTCWLATAKDVARLGSHHAGAPLHALEHEIVPDPRLVAWLLRTVTS